MPLSFKIDRNRIRYITKPMSGEYTSIYNLHHHGYLQSNIRLPSPNAYDGAREGKFGSVEKYS